MAKVWCSIGQDLGKLSRKGFDVLQKRTPHNKPYAELQNYADLRKASHSNGLQNGNYGQIIITVRCHYATEDIKRKNSHNGDIPAGMHFLAMA